MKNVIILLLSIIITACALNHNGYHGTMQVPKTVDSSQGNYVGAWEKVAKQRSLGGTPPGQFINLLRAKMTEPKW